MVFKKLSQINIVLFSEILETRNYLMLVKDYDENKDYSDELKEECSNTWIRLFDEYFELKNDGRARNSIKQQSELSEMIKNIRFTELTLQTLQNLSIVFNNDKSQIDTVLEQKQQVLALFLEQNPRVKLNLFDDFDKIINKIIKVHEAQVNRYQINDTRLVQTENKAKTNIEESIVKIQNVLGYSVGDLKLISVPFYVQLEKSAINISNQRNKSNSK